MYRLSPQASIPDLSVTTSTRIDRTQIDSILFLQWEEHCIECYWPDCFQTCALYEDNKRGGCARFVYGIAPNPNFHGLFDFGADITFKRWAKLEAKLENTYRVRYDAQHHPQIENHRPVSFRPDSTIMEYDAFIVECYNASEQACTFVIEVFQTVENRRVSRYRSSFCLKPGINYFELNLSGLEAAKKDGYLCVYPENASVPIRIIFTYLDFILFTKDVQWRSPIKCVAWDLDDTLWEGIISEEKVKLRTEAVHLIKMLDERGILQTITSKNDHQQAWDQIKRFGLDKYFLHPQINWDMKSNNIRRVADKLNIGIDTIAVIDDSPFERSEIEEAIPMCRTYDGRELSTLLSDNTFQRIVSSESKNRRKWYLDNSARELLANSIHGDYDEFLRQCKMKLLAFLLKQDEEILRCYELMQRVNQYWAGERRLTLEELKDATKDPAIRCIGIKVSDRFGDYGIVGCCMIEIGESELHITNFTLSCRVAQKKVEQTFLGMLHDAFPNHPAIQFQINTNERNAPLLQVINSLSSRLLSNANNVAIYEIRFETTLLSAQVMETDFILD